MKLIVCLLFLPALLLPITTATKDPDDEPKIDDFDWQGDVYQHRKTIDAKDPDIYHYELGADIEGYKFQNYDIYTLPQIIELIHEILEMDDVKRTKRHTMGALYFYNHLLTKMFLEKDALNNSWTLQVKMNFMKLEVKISNFFVDTIYKSKSYVKLQTVINQLLKNIFKQSDSAKDIVKYFNDNVMNDYSKRLMFEFNRLGVSCNSEEARDGHAEDLIAFGELGDFYDETIKNIHEYNSIGFELSPEAQVQALHLDSVLPRSEAYKKSSFGHLSEIVVARYKTTAIMMDYIYAFQHLKDQSLFEKLLEFSRRDVEEEVSVSVLKELEEELENISEQENIFKNEADKENFNAARERLIKNMLNNILRLHKNFGSKEAVLRENSKTKVVKIWAIILNKYVCRRMSNFFSQNRDYAEKLFQIDNFVELDRPIAQSVLQMRTDDSVNGFLEGLGEHMIRTGENAISENLIQFWNNQILKKLTYCRIKKTRDRYPSVKKKLNSFRSLRYRWSLSNQLRVCEMEGVCKPYTSPIRNENEILQMDEESYMAYLFGQFSFAPRFNQILFEARGAINMYKSAEQKDDKHAIESAASTLYGYLQQMENLRSRFHPETFKQEIKDLRSDIPISFSRGNDRAPNDYRAGYRPGPDMSRRPPPPYGGWNGDSRSNQRSARRPETRGAERIPDSRNPARGAVPPPVRRGPMLPPDRRGAPPLYPNQPYQYGPHPGERQMHGRGNRAYSVRSSPMGPY